MSLKIDVTAGNSSQNLMNLIIPKNLSPFFKDVGKLWVNAMHQQFESEGAYFLGHKWEELAESTEKQRISNEGPSYKILNRSAGDAGLLGSFGFVATADSVEVGFSNYYAVYHQFGSEKTNLPARPLFPGEFGSIGLENFPQDLIDDMYMAFLKFLSKRMTLSQSI